MSNFNNASLIVTPNGKKAGKLYALKGADLDVVRATTATYVGSDGLIKTAGINEVRFDYTNGSCPSILVEPQRTNLILRSEEFDNASWSKLNVTVTENVTTAPNGNLSADKIIATATDANHIAFNNPASFVSSQSYTFSYYAKSAEYTKTAVRIGGAGYSIVNRAEINLSNGTIIYQQGFTSLQVKSVGNGWYRIQGTFVSASAITPNIQPLSDSYSVFLDNYKFLGDGTSGIFVWGAQLEVGSNATSYIPTTTTSVTRNADVISKTGISSLIGQTQGTLYWEGRLQGQSFSDGITRMLLSISDGITNNRIEIYRSNNAIHYDNVVGGAVQFSAPVFTITDFTGQPLKLAITYTLNNVKVFINGVLVNTDTTALIPACNQTNIGCGRVGTAQWSGLIKGAVLLPLLTNAQAIQLTTL